MGWSLSTRVSEQAFNSALAKVLTEMGVRCDSERLRGRSRPDILCRVGGLNVVIETSFDRGDAEKDARRRLEGGLADVSIALYVAERPGDVSEAELERWVREQSFEVKVLTRQGSGQWTRADVGSLALIIEREASNLVGGESLEESVREVRKYVGEFIEALEHVGRGALYDRIYDVLYKLYGMEVVKRGERRFEVVYGQAALSVLMSLAFYEHAAPAHGLPPLDCGDGDNAVERTKEALKNLLKIDYRPVLEVGLEVLSTLPSHRPVAKAVCNAVKLAKQLIARLAVSAYDFVGQIYHAIVGDLSVRKGLATYYTEVLAAHLLAALAVDAWLGGDVEKIRAAKVADFACGSGTLLTATFNALVNKARRIALEEGLSLDVNELKRGLVEGGLYGFDVLKYAAQVTALNLAMAAPPPLSRQNVYAVYLGVEPKTGTPWLGSLELLMHKDPKGLLRFVDKKIEDVVRVTVVEDGVSEEYIPREFDIVIMNPPFTRATGRTEEFGEGRGLFGFVAEERARDAILRRYNELRRKVAESLRELAEAYSGEFPPEVRDVVKGVGEFAIYHNIGQAGEGFLFLYLAYRHVKEGGVIAFVLPRNLLSGVSWLLARVLLSTRFHLRYVIVSADGERGHNFSESASLSEVLIVAKRRDKPDKGEKTAFVTLFKKPAGVFEAVKLAEALAEGAHRLDAEVVEVGREELLRYVVNWNAFFLGRELYRLVNDLVSGRGIAVGGVRAEVPVVQFRRFIKAMGVNRGGDIIEAFGLEKSGQRVACERYKERRLSYLPMLCSSGQEVVRSMKVKPNAYVPDRDNPKARYIKTLRSRLLVPDRIWWPTSYATAVYSDEELIANRYFMVKTDLSKEQEKALVLWLNSVWGILTILSSMEVTRSAFTRLNISQWKLLPVLDVNSLDANKVRCLASAFDAYAEIDMGPIRRQFEQKMRLGLDLAVLKCLAGRQPSSGGLDALYESVLRALGALGE